MWRGAGGASRWEGRLLLVESGLLHPGAGCFCLVLAIRTKDSSLGAPGEGEGLSQAGGITSLL